MSEFVFLYRGGEAGHSPERAQQTMQKWMGWFKEMGEKGQIVNPGHPLETNGKVVQGKGKTVIDGPFAEAKDLIGGFTLIEAPDLDHAAEIAKGCPIYEVDGSVEVRPIRKMNM